MENMPGQHDVVERRTTELCQPLDQRRGRIEGGAWKRPKAGDEDPQALAYRSVLAHRSISEICSAASAGEMRPPATSASIRFTLARTDVSERNRAIVSCSSIDHIHFTCCCCRRLVNSPEAFIAVR